MHLEEYDAAHRLFPLDHLFRGISWRWANQYRALVDPVYFSDTVRTALSEDPFNPLLRQVVDELKEHGP